MIREIIRPLLQEIYQDDGWKMLVCCMLVNLTNRKQVDTIRDKLFNRYPTPQYMMNAEHSELVDIIKPLGLYNTRADRLIKMSEGYVKGFKSVDELYGIGQYAKDSWDIFQNSNKIEVIDSIAVKNIMNNHKSFDVIYPYRGENYDFISNLNSDLNLKLNYIYDDYDLFCWQFSDKSFFNFRKNIPKILAKFVL